jgi:hypothetical protein
MATEHWIAILVGVLMFLCIHPFNPDRCPQCWLLTKARRLIDYWFPTRKG